MKSSVIPVRRVAVSERAHEQAPPAGTCAITVRLVTSLAEFAALGIEWNRLHETAQAASVFNSWTWLYEWWRVYGADQPLRILVAERGGVKVGLIALYVHEVRIARLPVRVLRFVGTGGDTSPEDLGPLLEPQCEADAALALAQAIVEMRDVDLCVLSDIDPASVFPHALERAAREQHRVRYTSICERIPYIELPASWQAFLKSLPSKRRSGIRCARAKLMSTDRDSRFFVWDDASKLDQALERLARLHHARWEAAGGSDSFTTHEYIEFHRRIMNAFMQRGWLRLYCLELFGETVAMNYCYRFRNRIFSMQTGFDPKVAALSPGNVLLGYAIEHAIGEGNEVFDFLRGDYMYKKQLANGSRDTVCVRVFSGSARGFLYGLRRIWLPTWKARLFGTPLYLQP